MGHRQFFVQAPSLAAIRKTASLFERTISILTVVKQRTRQERLRTAKRKRSPTRQTFTKVGKASPLFAELGKKVVFLLGEQFLDDSHQLIDGVVDPGKLFHHRAFLIDHTGEQAMITDPL